jgi:hypothetical protein
VVDEESSAPMAVDNEAEAQGKCGCIKKIRVAKFLVKKYM